MRRGDVFLADLEPVRGSEANKARPVVLVGNNAALAAVDRFGRGVVTVVPCNSNATLRGAMHVLLHPTRLNGLTTPSKAQAEQVRSIDVDRLQDQLGRLGVDDLESVDAALRFHLSL